jgi:uroporphyrinogen decarboxylase
MGLEAVPMIAFPKGAWYSLDAVCNLGYNVVGLDWLHDPAEAVKIIGDRPMVIQGNADPGVLYGSHAAITEAVSNMVEGYGWAKRHQGWIVNLGHGEYLEQFIMPEISPSD